MKTGNREELRSIYWFTINFTPLLHAIAVAASMAFIVKFDMLLVKIIAVPVFSIALVSLATTTYALLYYWLRPYCPVCGMELLDCKVDRQSLAAHPYPQTKSESKE